ncbi:MAG: ATP phosphoribosyltransferase regulatory subunit [Lachnospiraceae bacterium]|nr:ATP phosphoribosyltransferase regulatory subunit [Lachnospiraceae bacterium]
MKNDLLHTPDGVTDLFGEELKKRLAVQETILGVMREASYQDIKPPTFEYFDVFQKSVSATPARDLFKFFDKDGNTLVLRSDFTPQIARCVSSLFPGSVEGAVRVCYAGDVYLNASDLQGKRKQTTQTGLEFFGDASVSADAEVISLLIRTLLAAGLEELQVSIGHADFFRGICEESGLDREQEALIRTLIADRNYFAAEKQMFDLKIRDEYREMLLRISDFAGDPSQLKTAGKIAGNRKSLDAIARLSSVYEALAGSGLHRYVSFDLGMLSRYDYYTGVTFEAYTYGVGDAIAKGGRYDDLLGHFGKDAPATGFAITLDDLMTALARRGHV